MIKMQGGVFGAVSDSKALIRATQAWPSVAPTAKAA